MIPAEISALLTKVNKPSRYAGGEVNIVVKPPAPGLLRVALAFPDVYEVGMSHLGLKILYKVINEQENAAAERVFAPWPDMGDLMRDANVALYGLETYTPLRQFDVVGFTLQYELSYTNILYMLDLAGIPLRSDQRTESDPLVIAGGPCAFNVEPMADYLDCVVLGEGEEIILEMLACLKQHRGAGRAARLRALSQIPGVYVPALYEAAYHDDGTFALISGVGPLPIEKRLIKELGEGHIPIDPVVPYIDVVHDRVMLEAFRGCTRGCRFCQAGMIYRPVRETRPDVLLSAAQRAIASTGYEEVALTSLSTMDYSAIGELLPVLVESLGCQGVNVSLPSLRVDSFSVTMAAEVVKMRKSGLTLAPEAGSQRLRDVINKQVTADDLLRALQGARQLGFKSAKLYFMIGLPTETYEDLAELVHLVEQAARILPVTVSTSSFVPKSHTPFQWEPQFSIYELEQRQSYLSRRFAATGRLSTTITRPESAFLRRSSARVIGASAPSSRQPTATDASLTGGRSISITANGRTPLWRRVSTRHFMLTGEFLWTVLSHGITFRPVSIEGFWNGSGNWHCWVSLPWTVAWIYALLVACVRV
jgi:radical SAM family uncharacterized protein